MNKQRSLIGFYPYTREWFWVEPVHKFAMKKVSRRSLSSIINKERIVGSKVVCGSSKPLVLYMLARR